MYRRNGKEILKNGAHFGDGVNEEAAALIVDALNAWCSPLNTAVPAEYAIDPDLATEPKESDYDWDVDAGMIQQIDASTYTVVEHHMTRQSDEYACSCGARWSVDEGEDHP